MGGVSVSRDALIKARRSFSDFQTDVGDSFERVKKHTDEVLASVKITVKEQTTLVETLEKAVLELAAQVERHLAQIRDNNNRIAGLNREIAAAQAQIRSLQAQAASLRAQKGTLSSRQSSGGNQADNSSQSNALDSQIRHCEIQQSQLAQSNGAMRGEVSALQEQTARLKEAKMQAESELVAAKSSLNKAKDKLERLKSASGSVESALGSLVGTISKFRQSAAERSGASTAGINQCIALVDAYLAVNLSGGAAAQGASARGSSPQSGDSGAAPAGEVQRALFELSALREDLGLTSGNPSLPQLGGSWSEVRAQLRQTGLGGQYQAHHIPSAAAMGANPDDNPELWQSLPTIALSNADHLLTDSFGGRQSRRHRSFLPDVPRSDSYRNEAAGEIAQGNIIDVVRNEIYNIIDRFGHAYDGGISRYLDAMETYLQENGMPRAPEHR